MVDGELYKQREDRSFQSENWFYACETGSLEEIIVS